MINKICGWLLFLVITISVFIPICTWISGEIPIECWEERRLGHNNKYQPSTIYVKVCGAKT